ncbi:MAG TPA: AraC family transcriptional regulator [Arachidicoccus sp.]
MMPSLYKQFTFKKFGYYDFQNNLPELLSEHNLNAFIKIILIKAGGNAVIDFKEYHLTQDALFFINAGQYVMFDENCEGSMIYYNRDFYCVEIHDKEVACDGILFHNVYEIPVIFMNKDVAEEMNNFMKEIKQELEDEDYVMEEMLRVFLKQIIIKSTRIWKKEHQKILGEDDKQEVDFLRRFSQLVEWHYKDHHTVGEYAELLNISPKALNKRITRYSNETPNDIIKNRIMLEAKRLLAHTSLSVKEIGYKLGYDDPSYFIRLFTKQAETTPQHFRTQYQQN